jgi:hypothetical protein
VPTDRRVQTQVREVADDDERAATPDEARHGEVDVPVAIRVAPPSPGPDAIARRSCSWSRRATAVRRELDAVQSDAPARLRRRVHPARPARSPFTRRSRRRSGRSVGSPDRSRPPLPCSRCGRARRGGAAATGVRWPGRVGVDAGLLQNSLCPGPHPPGGDQPEPPDPRARSGMSRPAWGIPGRPIRGVLR